MIRAMRSARWVAMLALALASCGTDSHSSPSTAVSTADTSVAVPTSEVATPADRERNAQAQGWGADGSGIATTPVANTSLVSADVRVFRRVHIENTNGMRVVSNQDAFVTVLSRVTRKSGTSIRLAVHGFVTRDGGVKDYAMAGFGQNGIATIDLPNHGADWSPLPVSWTVVSRDTVAVAYVAAEAGAERAALIEYRKTASGELDTRFGNAGSVIIDTKSFGVNAVYDITLRMIEDNGAPHLVVLAADNLDDGHTNDMFVIGLNPDGSRDAAIGKNGVASVKQVLGDNTFAQGYLPRLADPGIDNSGKVLGIGVAMTFIDFDPDDGAVPASQLGLLYAELPADDPKNVAVSVQPSPSGFPMILGAGLDPASPRFTLLTSDPDAGLQLVVATRDKSGIAATASPQANNMKGLPIGPFSVATSMIGGTWFGAQLTPRIADGEPTGSLDVVICFDEQHCAENDTAVTRPALEAQPDVYVAMAATSVVTGEQGTSVAVMRLDQAGGAGIVSFDPAGVSTTQKLPAMMNDFVKPVYEVNKPLTALPAIVNRTTLAAGHTSNYTTGMTDLVVREPGAPARNLRITPPLGMFAYSWTPDRTAVLDETSIVAVSQFADADGKVHKRLNKVSLVNGSTVVPFGSTDAVEVAQHPQNPDLRCGIVETLESGLDVVAYVQFETRFVVNLGGLGPHCAVVPTWITWTSVRSDGQTTSSAVDETNFDDDERVARSAPSPDGSLVVLSYVDKINETTRVLTSTLRLRKFLLTGQLDTSFDDKGIASFSEVTDDVFRGIRNPAMTLDSTGRIYLADVRPDEDGQTAVVVRLTAQGAVDRAPDKVAKPSSTDRPQPTRDEILRRRAELLALRAASTATAGPTAESATAPSVVTVTGENPVLLSVRAVEDRSLTVTWGLSPAVGDVYVTATALPGGRSCTVRESSCVIRGLDPSEEYRVVVSKRGEPVPDAATSNQPATKPVRILRPGQVASPSAIVKPASRGKATWRVSGKCTLNPTFTKLTTPKQTGRCRLAVTTAKDGKTPKTTRSVMIVVTK